MGYQKRLERAFKNALHLPISVNTKYVFISDCHRGCGNNNDNFLKNVNPYLAALQYYYQSGYHYVEVGDGDELWENKNMQQIKEIHPAVFNLLQEFDCDKRLSLLYGNHDIVKRNKHFSFMNFKYKEGLILENTEKNLELRITHGHQADPLNSVSWRLARTLVRHLWTPLEVFGISDPTSAAKNNHKQNRLEKKYLSYARKNHCYLLTGHTHRPSLCTKSSPYCNCGSCVHPQGITCIELSGYKMELVKWYVTIDKNGHRSNIYPRCPPAYPLSIKREIIHSEWLTNYDTSS